MKTWLAALLLFIFACSQKGNYPKSDHYDGSKFFNPDGPGLKSFWSFLKWRWESLGAPAWPELVPNKDYKLPTLESGKGMVTFINHATFLIQLPGVTILTDPIFSERAGPFENFGPVKRVRAPGVNLEELPPVDLVVISHNHYDHMDKESLIQLDRKYRPLFLVPLGDELTLKEWGLQNVRALDWWEEQKVKSLRIIFTPVQHWSSRAPFDKNESLWGGYFIESESLKIYFAGDTGYTHWFRKTRERLGIPDLALLPIGAYAPRWFMRDHHMNPEEALQAHLDLEAKLSLGMHFGTFKLTDEAYEQPLIDLGQAREKLKVSEEKFRVLDFGESMPLL